MHCRPVLLCCHWLDTGGEYLGVGLYLGLVVGVVSGCGGDRGPWRGPMGECIGRREGSRYTGVYDSELMGVGGCTGGGEGV